MTFPAVVLLSEIFHLWKIISAPRILVEDFGGFRLLEFRIKDTELVFFSMKFIYTHLYIQTKFKIT